MARVSIIVPAYNPGPLLERALASLAGQSFADWECVVIDDGGEQALDWVDSFHPNVFRHRRANAGVSVARNTGLQLTSAPLVAYLDQDDEWHPEKLAKQLPTLESGDVSYTAFLWVYADGRETPWVARPIDYRWLLEWGHLCLSTMVV